MATTEIKFHNPEFPTEKLDQLIFALQGRMSELFVTEKFLTADKAIEYLGIGETTFYKLVKIGQIKQYFFKGLSTAFYLPSQMYETIKSNKQ